MITEDWLSKWSPDSVDELRFRLTILLAPTYMTTNANMIDPDTIAADALKDARRLKAAVDAVIKTLETT